MKYIKKKLVIDNVRLVDIAKNLILQLIVTHILN
jgi:hypothetical protein